MIFLLLSLALSMDLPWIRLTVIGAVSYYVPAAEAALQAFGSALGLSQKVTDIIVFATITWVMVFGCIMTLILVPLLCIRYSKNQKE